MGYVNGTAGPSVTAPDPATATTQGQQNTPERSRTATPVRGFRKAVKFDAKARVALIGVSGSGKSYTALTLARALAGPTGKIAAIDTEHGSLSKYADQFSFDVDEPESYSNDYLLEQLTFAEENGYAVFVVDSLSHFWMGRDGALEFVDNARRRTRDGMEGWKMFRPHEREMVDRFIASPCHVIVTMRTKTDYEEQIVDGKKKRVKIGLAPVQRDGLEYEFDFVGSMDDENNLLVDKTRCSAYSQERMRSVARPGASYFAPFIDWLRGEKPDPQFPRRGIPASELRAAAGIDTGGHGIGTAAAAQHVAQQKLQAASAGTPPPTTPAQTAPANDEPLPNLPDKSGDAWKAFQAVREQIGEVRWAEELELAGVKDPTQFRKRSEANACYQRMLRIARLQSKEVA